MVTQTFPQTTIAVIWDFDDTLIPGSMQRPIFQKYGIDENSFWREVNGLSKYYVARSTKISQSSAYLNHILTYVQHEIFSGLNNKELENLGAEIAFFDGIPEFFQVLKNQVLTDSDFRKHEITVELYVVSTGLSRMIRGSEVSSYVDDVWGCEFIEEVAQPGYMTGEQGQLISSEARLSQIGYLIDDTTKTRAIFEINKGVNKYPNIDVNSQILPEHRRVPFTNMVYVADGPSDIPVFSLLKLFGGRTFAVYQPESEKHFDRVYELQRQHRIEAFGPADYRKGTQTSMWIVKTVRDIASRIVADKEDALRSAVQPPPGHIEAAGPPGGSSLAAQVRLPDLD